MESLKAILDMNSKHPPGRRSRSIDDLVAHVKELEKENRELREERDERRRMASELLGGGPLTPEELQGDYVLRGRPKPPADREKAQEGGQETPGGAIPPLFESGPPSDDELVAFLRGRPGTSLAQICGRFGVVCGKPGSYTPEAKAIRNQLQRLRKARKIRCGGMKWEAR